ncbi:PLAP4 [Auxenochlorella protothecoides x Auxenochlorella symbiontica]
MHSVASARVSPCRSCLRARPAVGRALTLPSPRMYPSRSQPHRVSPRRVQQERVEQTSSNDTSPHPDTLVDTLLQDIQSTDAGDSVSPPQRARIDDTIRHLARIGDGQDPRPLRNPDLFGNFAVAYVSPGTAQPGAAAGGRFRSTLGKALFPTRGLFQSVLSPDIVVNKVCFALLGLIPGSVVLRGKLQPIPNFATGSEETLDTVKVSFEPPVLSLGEAIHIRVGPPSTVSLQTVYVDRRVRLGLGSRGSLFVFTRGGAADAQAMEAAGLHRTGKLSTALLFAALLTAVGGGAALAARATTPVWARAAGGALALLAAALASVVWRGGILEDATWENGRRVEAA